MANVRTIKVFISSPGDVPHERAITRDVIETLNNSQAFRELAVVLEPIAWDVPGALPMEANIPPQEAIDRGLTRPSECEIVLAVFWMRMGTPLVMDGVSYLSGTHYEYHEALKSTLETGMPRILVYRRTQKKRYALDDPDIYEKIEQYKTLQRFFQDEFSHTETGRLSGGYNRYETPDDYQKQLEGHLLYLAKEIAKNLPRVQASEKKVTWDGSPFPGLRAFQEEDQPIFFGRSEETFKLAEKVQNNQFIAVVGASGSGKSSLVRAGLIPRLKKISEANSWEIITLTPDEAGTHNPFESIATALSNAYTDVELGIDDLTDDNWQDTLTQIVNTILDNQTKTAKLLIFIDQFEELFTTVHEQYRDHYIDILQYFDDHNQVHIILTLRGDFYGVCINHPRLAELLEESTFPLAAPRIGAIYEMITRPADYAGLDFEGGLPQRIMDDTGTEPGALALMAFALEELHKSGTDNLLTHRDYEDLGLVQGAIGVRSESVFKEMTKEEQSVMPYVFRELVSVEDDGTVTRKRASINLLRQKRHTISFIKKLTEARLLVTGSGRDGEPYAEVAHEALLRGWDRLVNWIKDVHADIYLLQQVRQAAAEWENLGRPDYLLWPHERLRPVYRMQNNLDVEFSSVEQAFTTSEIERKFELFKKIQVAYLRNKLGIGEAMRLQKVILDRFRDIGADTTPYLLKLKGQSAGSAVARTITNTLDEFKEEKLKAEEESRRKIEEERQAKVAEEAQRKAEEERLIKEVEAKRQTAAQAEAERQTREAEAKSKVEEERKAKESEVRLKEYEQRKADFRAKLKASQAQTTDPQKNKVETTEAKKRKAEAEAQRKREERWKRQREERRQQDRMEKQIQIAVQNTKRTTKNLNEDVFRQKLIRDAQQRINRVGDYLREQWDSYTDVIDVLEEGLDAESPLKEQLLLLYIGEFRQRYNAMMDLGQIQDNWIMLCAIDLLSDSNVFLQSAALTALEMQKNPIVISFVAEMTNSPDKEIRDKAQSVIDRLQSYA